MPETQAEPMVRVGVYDHTGKPLPKAEVSLVLRDAKRGRRLKLEFNPQRAAFVATGIAAGTYQLAASAKGLAADERDVHVDPAGLEAVVVLGKASFPSLYRGEVKTPFEPHPDLVAIALAHRTAGAAEKQVAAVARRAKLKAVRLGEPIRRQHIRVYRFPGKYSDAQLARLERDLQAVEGVLAVGAVVRLDGESVSFLTHELVVKFKSHVTVDELPELGERYRLTNVRPVPQAGNAFLFQTPGPASYTLLETAHELVKSGLVEYAEPNLFSSVVLDALNPGDFLFPMQWHLPLIHCPDAWQAIHDNISPDFAYGSPQITIAVVDTGTDLANPDFVGNVSNGNPKVAQVFDFTNMVANNSTRQSGHGTCTAGVTTALVDNPSGVPGQEEGVVGAAGNCRLMACEFPSSTELDFSDMYVWIAGFDPGSSRTGFPAALAQGAEVITNSFGSSVGMPISGLMKDTFDLLTTYGRAGRGVLLFFSAGNAGMDFTLQRPWAAYNRTYAVAASSLAADGVTEVHAGYSNFGGVGMIDFCTPSDSTLGAPYNPPTDWAILTTGADEFAPDAPSHRTAQTSTTAAAAPGGTSLTVASSAGFTAGGFIVVGTPGAAGAEFGMVTAVPDVTHLTVTSLKDAHPAGTDVFGGPAHSFSAFGGTSSATPLAAGVGALLLTVRPSLTWIQVRDILRGTAVHIDAANTDPVGIWTDQNGVASNQPGYLGPVYSRWYGSGRLDALAAVNGVFNLGATADLVVRDNLGDSGFVPAVGTFWDSPDIWVRNLSPAGEGAAALPANYATPGPNLPVQAGQDNYVYLRVKNTGPVASSDFRVRLYLSHWAGPEFVYPTDFIPTNHPGQPLPSPLVPGTYLLGEVQHGPLAANASDIVNVTWQQAAIPPETVTVMGSTVHWHPCLLAEITPQDGPTPSGVHVWDNNNLGQKNVSIVYSDASGDFSTALVAGNLLNHSEYITIELDRSKVPAGMRLYVDVLDPKARRELVKIIARGSEQEPAPEENVRLMEETRVLVAAAGGPERVLTLPRDAQLRTDGASSDHDREAVGVTLGYHNGRQVFWLPEHHTTSLPLHGGRAALIPLIVGGTPIDESGRGTYLLGITQRDADGRASGAAAVEVRTN